VRYAAAMQDCWIDTPENRKNLEFWGRIVRDFAGLHQCDIARQRLELGEQKMDLDRQRLELDYQRLELAQQKFVAQLQKSTNRSADIPSRRSLRAKADPVRSKVPDQEARSASNAQAASPSPLRSGGEGRGEEALRAHGDDPSTIDPRPSDPSLDVQRSMFDVGCSQAGGTGSFESFPISSLKPPLEILEILHRWGIRTVGALLALGKDQVTERLGPAAAELFNRVSPDSPRPLKLVVPTEEFAEQMEFENEIETTEPLLFVLRRFVEQLSRRLELIYLVVAEFHLQLGLSSGAKYERLFKIPAPTGNIEILFRMLQTHLETVRTDSPITSLRLAARPAIPEAQQFGLFESTLRDPNQFAETLARLTGLCGADRVGTPQLLSTHKPDSFAMAAPEFHSHMEGDSMSRSKVTDQYGQFLSSAGATSPSPLRSGGEGRGEEALKAQGGTSFDVRRSAFDVRCSQVHGKSAQKIGPQLRRFRPALPSHIEFRDEKPALLRSHVFTGAIVETRGPFFSSGNWWDNGRWAREEWDIETSDGSLFRIFRSAEGCFVEGTYD